MNYEGSVSQTIAISAQLSAPMLSSSRAHLIKLTNVTVGGNMNGEWGNSAVAEGLL